MAEVQKEMAPWDEGFVDNTVPDPKVAPTPLVAPVDAVEKAPWDEGYQEPVVETDPVDASPMAAEDPRAAESDVPMSELKLGQTPDKTLQTVSANLEMSHDIDKSGINNIDSGVVGPEVYDRIDRKYPDVNKWDDFWGGHSKGEAAFNSMDNIPPEMFQKMGIDPNQFKQNYHARDAEKQQLYQRIGKDESSSYWGDYPVRIQRKVKPNLDYDPSQPESETNSKNSTEQYFVPPPDQNAMIRIGYDVARNLAGIGDLAIGATKGELYLSKEGPLRKNMPQMPMNTGEKFVSDMTSFALADKGFFKIAKVPELLPASKIGLAARMSKFVSPAAIERTKQVYASALKAGKSTGLATEAAQNYMKKITIGTAIGLTESAVASDDARGLVPPEWIQSLGADPRTAHDVSLMLDNPVSSGVLNTLGSAWNKGSDLISQTVGGVGTLSAKRAMKIANNEAGVKMATLIDPQFLHDAPELVVAKTKILSDTLLQAAQDKLTLGPISKNVTNDTTTSLMRSSQSYFRQAYSHLEDSMGTKDFNEWITEQSTHAVNKMLALRTAAQAEDPITRAAARRSKDVQDLFEESAAAQTTMNDVGKTTEAMTEHLADDQTGRIQSQNNEVVNAQQDLKLAQAAHDEGFRNTPEIRDLIEKHKDDFTLGSTTKINSKLKEALGDKLYSSFEKEYGGVKTAYEDLKNAGIETDEVSLLQKMKDLGVDDADIASSIAKSKGDYGVIATDTHNKLRAKIASLQSNAKSANDPNIAKYLALDDHIMNDQPNLIKDMNGDDSVRAALDNAKSKYIDYKTTWESLPETTRIADAGKNRFNKANLPAGIDGKPQGTADFNQTSIDVWEKRKNDVAGETTDAVLNAANKGGNPINKDMADILDMKTARDLHDKTLTGKENIASLRTSIRENINNMQKINPDGVVKYQALEKKLGEIDKNFSDAKVKEAETQKAFTAFKSEVDNSVAAKFVREVRGIKTPFKYEGVGNPEKVLDTVYRSKDSTNQISELTREADRIGGDKGREIKEALKGSYLEWVKKSMFTPSDIGLARVTDKGPEYAKNLSGRGLVNIFEDKGIEKNLTLLYGPEYVKQVRSIAANVDNATKKYNRGQDIDQGLLPSQDPRKGLTSIITLAFGVLNPRATTLKRFANPYGELKADDLLNAKKTVLIAAMVDPKTAAKVMQMAPQEQLNEKNQKIIRMWLAQAGAMTYAKEKDRNPSLPAGVR